MPQLFLDTLSEAQLRHIIVLVDEDYTFSEFTNPDEEEANHALWFIVNEQLNPGTGSTTYCSYRADYNRNPTPVDALARQYLSQPPLDIFTWLYS